MKKLHLEAVVIAEYECEDDEIEGLKHRLRETILSLYDHNSLTVDNAKAVCTGINVSPEWAMANQTTHFDWDKIRGFISREGAP